jgi:hypothetical protein
VPEDAALARPHPRLRRADTEVLIVPAGLLDARVEDDEVVEDLQQPCLAAELAQLPQQRVVAGRGVRLGLLQRSQYFSGVSITP